MAHVLHRRMTGRRTDEEHRAATPLELFFDLCFILAVAQASSGLHHAIAEGRLAHGVGAYLMVFFAIWWAWMNFTWFASAYDTDDVAYRIAVLVQITGSLIMAAGVSRAFDRADFTIMIIGYTVMRAALIAQWVRAAVSDPAGRATALRYAAGLTLVQACWVSVIFLPDHLRTPLWFVFVLADLAVPVLAERAGMTSWHPRHISERYGLFTLIALGESVTAATLAFEEAFDTRFTADLLVTVLGGVLVMSALWWLYFSRNGADGLHGLRAVFLWGYGHYLVFASAAAVGAGLAVAADHAGGEGGGHAGAVTSAAAVTVPTTLFLLTLWVLHRRPGDPALLVPGAAALILAATFAPGAVLVTGLILAALVAVKELSPARGPGRQ